MGTLRDKIFGKKKEEFKGCRHETYTEEVVIGEGVKSCLTAEYDICSLCGKLLSSPFGAIRMNTRLRGDVK